MDTSDNNRHSRARERRRRRRERNKVMTRATRPLRDSHLVPEGGLELSKVNIPYLRPALLAIGGLIFMAAVIYGVGLFTSDPVEAPPNALWIGEEWTYAPHDDATVEAFAQRLRNNRIGSVYAQVSELNFDRSWTGRAGATNQFQEVRGDVTAFAAQLKRFYPELDLYGVVGVQANLDEDGYRLDDADVQAVIVDFSTQVVGSLGFDGVMLNIDPVWNDDENFLTLLRQVRQAIGEGGLLAVALPPDWTPIDAEIPTPEIIEPGTVWSREYKQRVALIRADELVIRAYNSYLEDPAAYTEWLAYQVATYAEAVTELQLAVEVLVGVPTYDDLPPAHLTSVENIESALAGVRQGITAAGEDAAVISGVAIYADWATDDQEWKQFRENWLQ